MFSLKPRWKLQWRHLISGAFWKFKNQNRYLLTTGTVYFCPYIFNSISWPNDPVPLKWEHNRWPLRCLPPIFFVFLLLSSTRTPGACICKRLWSPEIDSEESIQLAYVAWVCIWRPFKEPRNRVPACLAGTQPYMSYWPARLHRLAKSIPQNRFLGFIIVYKYEPGCRTGPPGLKSIPGLLKRSTNTGSGLGAIMQQC